MSDLIVTANNRSVRKLPDIEVDGMNEREIFAMAPSQLCDRVHWVSEDDLDTSRIIAEMPMSAHTRKWSDGQHRIWVDAGRGAQAREFIKGWCLDHGIEPMNMRVEASVPFRDVDSIPTHLFNELLVNTVDWLYPRTFAIRKKLVDDLELVEDEDVRSMMYLFVSDHADRYDADRIGKNGTLNFTTYILGKIRKWPQDAARSAYGRNAIDDRMHINQGIDASMMTEYRKPTEHELATKLNTSVDDLRKRQSSLANLSGMRFYDSILGGSMDDEFPGVDAAADIDVEAEATSYDVNAALTRSLVDAAYCPTKGRGAGKPDPLSLAVVYLTFWGDMSRSEVANELEIGPKTAGTAAQRLLDQARTTASL